MEISKEEYDLIMRAIDTARGNLQYQIKANVRKADQAASAGDLTESIRWEHINVKQTDLFERLGSLKRDLSVRKREELKNGDFHS